MQLKEHFHFQFAATLEFHAFMQLCIIIKRWRWEWRCRWEKIWKKCIAYGYSKEHYHKNVLYFFSFWYLFRFAQQLALSYMKEHLTADAWSKPQTSNAFCNQWRRFYYCVTWDGGDPLTAIGVGVHFSRWEQNGASNSSPHTLMDNVETFKSIVHDNNQSTPLLFRLIFYVSRISFHSYITFNLAKKAITYVKMKRKEGN